MDDHMTNPALKQLSGQIGAVLKGKDTAVKMAIVCLVGRGNLPL